jgi:protein TonB
MIGPIVVAILVAHAAVAAQPAGSQQPPASAAPTTAEQPWPPAGVFRAGGDVRPPALVKDPKPSYSTAARKARKEGTVVLEAVVLADGTVGEVRVRRSLDLEFGLDKEAIRTLKLWRFKPGMKDGTAVPVLVEVEMTFSLRPRP